MLLRTALAALAVVAACIATAPVMPGAAAQQATTTANPRDGLRPPQENATVARATTSISCTSGGRTVTYTLSVRGGSCIAADLGSLTGSGGRANNASCSSVANGDEASATCTHGCGRTTGQGSCTQS